MYHLLAISSRHELAGTIDSVSLELQVEYLRSLGLHVDLLFDPQQREIEKLVGSANYDAAFTSTMSSFEHDDRGISQARQFNIHRLLMHLGQPFIGSDLLTQLLVNDKNLCARETGIAPSGCLITRSMLESGEGRRVIESLPAELYPAIIKPNSLSCSLGLSRESIAHEGEAVLRRLEYLFDRFESLSEVRIESYIEKACEYTVALLGNGETLACGVTAIKTDHRNGLFNDETNKKRDPVERIKDYRLVSDATRREELIFHARQAHRALGIRDFARLDFVYDDRAYLIDVNALPVLGHAFSWEWKHTIGIEMHQLLLLPLAAFHFRQISSGIPDPLPAKLVDLLPSPIREPLEATSIAACLPESTPPNKFCKKTALYSMQDRVSVETEVMSFLGALVVLLKPNLILETGTWHGATALAMARGLNTNRNGHLVTIEKDLTLSERARAKLAGLPVEVVCSDSLQYTPEGVIDLLFLDSHRATRALEFAHFREYLSPSALIVWHDAAPEHEHVFRAIEELYDEKIIDRILLPTPRGLTLSMLRDWSQHQ